MLAGALAPSAGAPRQQSTGELKGKPAANGSWFAGKENTANMHDAIIKPTIGVTPLYDTDLESVWMYPGYLNGVLKAGGVALILPYTEDPDTLRCAAAVCDGYLFTGGQDVDPMLYSNENRGFVEETNPVRDISEGVFFRDALDLTKPILGICRGVQIINVLMGGTLLFSLAIDARNNTYYTIL